MKTEKAPFVTGSIRLWLRAEALAVMLVGLALYARSGEGWGRFFGLFLLPDLSLLGYLIGPRVGAHTYNTVHSSIGPLLLAAAAFLGFIPSGALPLAFIWLTHIGMDRALGYGLKYSSAFGHTHLGLVGRARPAPMTAPATS